MRNEIRKHRDSANGRLLTGSGRWLIEGCCVSLRAAAMFPCQMYSTSTSQTAMMWQTLPASTKKWNTECM